MLIAMELLQNEVSIDPSLTLLLHHPLTDFNLQKALDDCSSQRREQALKFRHEMGQRESVAAYLLLCQGLKERYGISEPPQLGYHDGGKPFLVEYPDIHFNLSHCRDAAICAISNRPVGVDIESKRRISESLIRYAMNDAEQQQIYAAKEPLWEFLRLWTMKEALAKLIGTGLSNHTKDVLAHADEFVFHTIQSSKSSLIYTIAQHRK